MNVIKIIHIILYVIDALLVAYLVIDLAYKRHQFLKGKIKKIKSAKYLVLIVIILIVFIIHGYMRNFI